MEIKDLIVSLLDYDVNSEVRFQIKGENDEVEEFDATIDNTYFGSSIKDVTFKIELDGMVIIEESDYERLESQRDNAIDRVSELEEELESLRGELDGGIR